MGNIKLTIEMIPSTNFYNNVRSSISKKEWDIIRKKCYENVNYKCEICNENGVEQGYTHKLELHEIWEYDTKNKKQRLKGLISLCTRCHLCKHIGRAFAVGKQAEVFKHMEKVNNWNHKELVTYLATVFKEHKERSKIPWELELSYLRINYNIDKLVLAKGRTNKTKRPTWYKKKKKK